MIQARDIRIGNWASVSENNEQPKYIIVSQIKNRGIVSQYLGSSGHFLFEKLLPIPLNAEILEKCGFELSSKDLETYNIKYTCECTIQDLEFYQSRDISTIIIQWENYEDSTNNNYRYISLYNIKYLHQLQNLYYALTGKELIVNL